MDGLSETGLRTGCRPVVGLVLTGGGARSAYQVGVLLALAEMLPPPVCCQKRTPDIAVAITPHMTTTSAVAVMMRSGITR